MMTKMKVNRDKTEHKYMENFYALWGEVLSTRAERRVSEHMINTRNMTVGQHEV